MWKQSHLCFLMVRPASSISVGRLNSEHRLTNPLVWKGLPNKSNDWRESRRKDAGKTINLLLLAEKYFKEDIFPNVLGKIWSWLQSNFKCTSPFICENLLGSLFNWFLDKSSSLRFSASKPVQKVSGNISSLFPERRSSMSVVALAIVSGSDFIVLFERSRWVRCFKWSSRVSTLLRDTPKTTQY